MSQSSRTVPQTGSPGFLALLVLCFSLDVSTAQSTIEQWGMFEVALKGQTNDNPFLDERFSARFYKDETSVEVNGFYDGDGTYRVRFMPETQGRWRYVTRSSAPELDGKSGEFSVTSPSTGNHGPVRATNTFHFAYADGKPYKQIGTTCYVWNHQGAELEEQTLKTLAASPFNKLRFCVFPKRYDWNTNEPPLYPFEGRPPSTWDFERFNPKFFQHLERRIVDLQHLGIEADIILFHPYLHPSDVLWWSKGGLLRGQSPARLAFLRQVLEESPARGIEPIDKWQNPEYGGQAPDYYLVYLGKRTPTLWEFKLPRPAQASGKSLEDGMQFDAEVLDAWNMSVTPVEGRFTLKKKTDHFFGDKDGRAILLPGKPYIAIRIKRVR